MKKVIKTTFLLLAVLIVGAFLWGYEPERTLEELKPQYANAASQFVEINGANVHYCDEGLRDSVALVLVHGTSSSLHTWDGWVGELKNDFRIVRLDLPSFGLTGPNATQDYSTANFVKTIHDLLLKLGVKKCYIAGNSLGGNVAWNYALTHPDQTLKLILLDASGYPSNQSKSVPLGFKLAQMPVLNSIAKRITPRFVFESSLKNVYFDDSLITDALIDRYQAMTLHEGNRDAFLSRSKNMMKHNDNWKRIPEIKIPTLIQWGRHDLLVTVASAERFHQDLPNDTLIIYDNAGHVPMEEIAIATARDAKIFLNK